MNSTEKQELIDEFGPLDPDGTDEAREPPQKTPPEPPEPVTELDVEVEFDDPVENTRAENPADDHNSADETDRQTTKESTPADEKTAEVKFDFIGADSEPGSDRIGMDPIEAELADTKEKLLRVAAEFENFKKRRIREKDEHQKFANEKLIKDLLPVIDNLERALDSARQTGQAQVITSGLDLVIHEFLRVLSREGVEPIISMNRPFDPAYQEALQSLETPDAEPGTVVGEILRGYKIHGRILRAALVVVAREQQTNS